VPTSAAPPTIQIQPTVISVPPPTDTPLPESTLTPTPTASPTPAATPIPVDRTDPEEPTPFPTLSLPEGPVMIIETPTTNQSWPVPAQAIMVGQPENAINIVVLGSDQTAVKSVGRTDVMVIVSILPDVPSVSLLSIPRDFYAWLPSRGFNKINTAFTYGEKYEYPGGGPGLIKATIEYNLGIRVHYFARVSFEGFVQIVDALGGIDLPVECPLSDTFPDPDSPTGQTDIDLLPGIHNFDGKHALWYVRSRYRSSDFDRNRRQQQALRGMYSQIRTLDVIPRLPQIWSALKETVSTDLGLGEVLYLANLASRLDMTNVKSRFVGPGVVEAQHAPDGAYVLVADPLKLRALVSETLAPPAAGRANQRPFRVAVLNASPWAELGQVAAERLRWENFEVVSVNRAAEVTSRTYIIDYTTTPKGSPISYLMRIFRRQEGDVVSEPSRSSPVDFQTVLGADYNPCVGPWESQPQGE
jgi:LCP family protein required for cell wall assembly